MRIETMKEMDGTGEGQPVPKTASEAAAFFRCAVLACSMMGARCATNYGDACAGSAARVSCRGCSAGGAREALLRGVSASERVVSPALALPMPPRRRCEECGMDMGSSRHTPTTCRRTADALRAAASSGAAMARAAEREALAKRRSDERERARAEQRAKSAAVRAERAGARKVERAAKAAERTARAMRKAARAALLASGVPPADVYRRRAAHANRVDASERAGMVCPRIGCGNPAGQSKAGPWCARCLNIARNCLGRKNKATATHEEVARWLSERPSLSKERIDWDAVSDLGKVPDRELARRLKVSPAAVKQARQARGIPGAHRLARPQTSTGVQMEQSRECMRDERGRVRWDLVDWSRGSDADIAQAVGSCISSVRAARERLGIQSARARGAIPPLFDWSTVPLGQMSDRRLAAMIGYSRNAVAAARERLGIAPSGHRRKVISAVGSTPNQDGDGESAP